MSIKPEMIEVTADVFKIFFSKFGTAFVFNWLSFVNGQACLNMPIYAVT